MKKILEKFLQDKSDTRKILDAYLQLRKEFQELGFSEKDLFSPPKYTYIMFTNQQIISAYMAQIVEDVKNFGIDAKESDVRDYFLEKFRKIDELTPLSDGNQERTDSWDEDSE
jgi:hypothetical protein